MMPRFCGECKHENPYYGRLGDSPEVVRISCKCAPYPICFKKKDFTKERIKYMGVRCEDIIVKE